MSSPELSFYVELEPVVVYWLQLLHPELGKLEALARPGRHGTCNPVSVPDPGNLVRLKRRAQV